GRIEVLGKHTDYAGGRSLLCAIERGLCFAAAARADTLLRIHDARIGETAEIPVHPDTRPRAGHWSAYPATVAQRLAANFSAETPVVGADVAFVSDLPIAAGISSSSALVVGTYSVLAAINRLEERAAFRHSIDGNPALAEYLGAVENGLTYRGLAGEHGVGTFGGSEDHTAMLCAEPGRLIQYSFCPVRRERVVPLRPEVVFAIASSGVVAEKTGAALSSYNRLASLARAALAAWNRATRNQNRTHDLTLAGALASAGSVDALAFAIESVPQVDGFSADELTERARQFAIESEELIPGAGDALLAGRLDLFGTIVDRSMRNAVEMLHNQTPETIFLAEQARALGAVAASAFGAGFGGSVWAMVERERALAFVTAWQDEYSARFPGLMNAEFFITEAGIPATALND
ncbi:MAG TPA: galactokinase family protein, partial [Gemmatimonadaceae bacterium]